MIATAVASTLLAAVAGGYPALAADGAGKPSVPASSAAAATTKVKLMGTRFGRILVSGRGRALYLFTADEPRRTSCFGNCGRVWPPFRARGRLVAGRGVRQGLLGRIRRPNGTRQVTYNGHPLYHYVTDRAPGEVTCQNVFEFGGLWLVVNRRGNAIR